jgi:hypothetical protein
VPKNSIIRLFLPEVLASSLFVFESGLLFEGLQELEKVARNIEALEQKMDVIWHQAKSVNGDPVDGGHRLKIVHEPIAGSLNVKDSFAILAAKSDEIPFGAAVTVCGEADIFVDEDHGLR